MPDPLDEAFWTFTPLGVLGAPCFARIAAHRDPDLLYRPLHRQHLDARGALPGWADVRVISGRGREVLDASPFATRLAFLEKLSYHDDAGWVEVVVRAKSGETAHIVAHRPEAEVSVERLSEPPELATLYEVWAEPDLRRRPVEPLLWLGMFRALAAEGVVGFQARLRWTDASMRPSLREVAGMRPIDEVLREHGLSMSDTIAELATLRVTFVDGRLERGVVEVHDDANAVRVEEASRRFLHSLTVSEWLHAGWGDGSVEAWEASAVFQMGINAGGVSGSSSGNVEGRPYVRHGSPGDSEYHAALERAAAAWLRSQFRSA